MWRAGNVDSEDRGGVKKRDGQEEREGGEEE